MNKQLTENMPDEFLTPKEAAEILGYRPDTLRMWRKEHRGPHFWKRSAKEILDFRDLNRQYFSREEWIFKGARSPIRYTRKDLDIWIKEHPEMVRKGGLNGKK